MSVEPVKNIIDMDGEVTEPQIDPFKEPFTVDLIQPVTVDGVTIKEIDFDFMGRIEAGDHAKFERQWTAITGRKFNVSEIADPLFQEFYLVKASGLSLSTIRAISGHDKPGLYFAVQEYLGKLFLKTKRRKKPSAN
jgi:hypothetical protein